MPKYAKFLKGLLSNKARLEEACTVTMNERCFTVLLNKLPSKEKDPGSFTIPCDVGHLHIDNALADLGASISLMPYTMHEKLGLGEPKPTRMSLELPDRSIKYLRGIAEDVLIKIDKFVLPIDFVILDMREDSRIPIILGRPFLATAQAMIDVFNKKITLRVGSVEVIFDVDQSMKKPRTEDDECYGIDNLDTSNSEIPIWRIDHINTPYSQEETQNEHLYSASAIEIDEKIPELKDLPSHLEYAYLEGDESCRVIILSKLTEKEKTSLIRVLEKRKGAIAWKMSDIKGISPSFCTYKILMEESFKPVIQPQRSLNPKVQDVVKDEIVRLENLNIGELAEEEIKDKFPNEHLMILKAKLNDEEPWYADYVNYIVGKVVPPEWTPEKKKRFFSQVKNYFWDDLHAFRLCPDNVMIRCVIGSEILEILAHCHSGPTGGHHSASVTDLMAAAKNHFMELNELMELQDGAYENIRIYKERTKKWHDSRLRGDKDFKNGDKVLLFNSRLKLHPGKLKSK
ncbi:DNA-directed DNA polymerase [Tanacetum coccineum]